MNGQTRNTKDSVQCAQFCMLRMSVCVVSLLSLSTIVSMKVLKVYLSLYTLLRSHLFVNFVSGGILFSPPVGDSRLLSAVTDIITINFAFNSC